MFWILDTTLNKIRLRAVLKLTNNNFLSGRPSIAKVLLKFGANPDLRDEDGKITFIKFNKKQN